MRRMMRQQWRGVVTAAAMAVILGTGTAAAQRASAVPQLDLDKLTGTWYQVARLPEKAYKKCVTDGTVLYALNDKHDSFQRGIFCVVKGGDRNNINDSGVQDKKHPGELKVRHWVLFHRPQWVLAHDPQFRWALVGTPNHKSLWVLSRQAQMQPAVYQGVLDQAAAQGYAVNKLEAVGHPEGRLTIASPSANPEQIETPTPAPTKTAPGGNSSGGGPGGL